MVEIGKIIIVSKSGLHKDERYGDIEFRKRAKIVQGGQTAKKIEKARIKKNES